MSWETRVFGQLNMRAGKNRPRRSSTSESVHFWFKILMATCGLNAKTLRFFYCLPIILLFSVLSHTLMFRISSTPRWQKPIWIHVLSCCLTVATFWPCDHVYIKWFKLTARRWGFGCLVCDIFCVIFASLCVCMGSLHVLWVLPVKTRMHVNAYIYCANLKCENNCLLVFLQ